MTAGQADAGAALPPGAQRAVERLDELDSTPVSSHVELFDGVHRLLQDELATLDEA